MPNSSERPWLSFYSQGIPSNLDYPDIPLHSFLTRSSERFPERPAIIYLGDEATPPATLTYQELDRHSGCFAAGLAGMGVGRGDRVAYFLQKLPPAGYRLLRNLESRRRAGALQPDVHRR